MLAPRPRSSLIFALLIVGAFFATTPIAQAGFLYLRYSTDGGTSWTDITGTGITDGTVVDGLRFKATSDVSPGGTQAKLDLSISNVDFAGAAENRGYIVQVALTDLAVQPNPQLKYAFTGNTEGTPATMQMFLNSTADKFNNTANPIFAPIGLNNGGKASLPGSSNYALMTEIRFSTVQGEWLDLDGNASVTATPAPGGVVLVLTGLPLFGLLAARARRRKEAGPVPATDALNTTPPGQ